MKAFTILACGLLAVSVSAQFVLSEEECLLEFANFVSDFHREYETNELFLRYKVFKTKLDQVRKHNAGNFSWIAGLNEFSDRTDEEVAKALGPLPFRLDASSFSDRPVRLDSPPANDIDWRSKGAVITQTKNMGQCGASWAFSTTGTLEGYGVTVKKLPLEAFSDQQLIDCTKPDCHGCNGCYPITALNWFGKGARGPCKQTDYPYIGRDGTCKTTCKPVFTITGGVSAKGEDNLERLLNVQPVSVIIDASSSAFQTYRGGIFEGPCSSTQPNHAMLAVGYTSDYWILKNWWGLNWGQSGHINIRRGKNLCGVGDWLAVPKPQP